MRADDRVAHVLRTGRRAAGLQVDHVEHRDRRLDRVQRRQHPGAHAGPRRRVARHQRLGVLAQVHDDGARLEQHQAVVVDRRHLAERLHRPVGGRLLVLGADQHHLVGQARFLERPAHAQVAHQALGERRHPAEGAEADHDFAPASVAAKASSTWPQPLAVARRARRGRTAPGGSVSSVLLAVRRELERDQRLQVGVGAALPSHWKVMTIRSRRDDLAVVAVRACDSRSLESDGETVGAADAEIHVEARGREALRDATTP